MRRIIIVLTIVLIAKAGSAAPSSGAGVETLANRELRSVQRVALTNPYSFSHVRLGVYALHDTAAREEWIAVLPLVVSGVSEIKGCTFQAIILKGDADSLRNGTAYLLLTREREFKPVKGQQNPQLDLLAAKSRLPARFVGAFEYGGRKTSVWKVPAALFGLSLEVPLSAAVGSTAFMILPTESEVSGKMTTTPLGAASLKSLRDQLARLMGDSTRPDSAASYWKYGDPYPTQH